VPNAISGIDATLGRVQQDVAQLGGRLFELDAERERREGEVDGFAGQTQAAWQDAQDQVIVLWAWYRALSEAVGSIAVRRQAPGLGQSQIDSLRAEITGAPVALPAESIELARRCLPEEVAAAGSWPIDALIGLMSGVLQRATETIASIFVARDMGLPKLDEIAVSLTAAEDAAQAAGARVPNEAASVKDRLTTLRERLGTDPLSVPVDDIGDLSVAAARLAQEIDQAVADVTGVDEALDRIEGDLETGLQKLSQARQDALEVEAKIAAPRCLIDAAEIDVLASSLTELQASLVAARDRAMAGDRTAALRLTAALGPAAAQARDKAMTLAGSAAAPLARRRELRGRLDAYRAKVHSLGLAEDPDLGELHQGAQDSLYTAPCDLDEAERRLAAYQAHITRRAQQEKRHEM
jgi:hypothetical protein